jgi:hypothetical protein
LSIQIPNGWTAWTGGENPVPGKRVRFMMRDEASKMFERAMPSQADSLEWAHRGLCGDIIAYQVF